LETCDTADKNVCATCPFVFISVDSWLKVFGFSEEGGGAMTAAPVLLVVLGLAKCG
jgi:hypothetical protein